MKRNSLLDDLCTQHQIQCEYRDINGHQHHAPERVQRAILKEMGVVTDSKEAMEQALATTITYSGLPPVQVIWEGQNEFQISIGVPENRWGHQFSWCIEQEGGGCNSGTFCLAELILVERGMVQNQRVQSYHLVMRNIPAVGYHRFKLSDLNESENVWDTMTLIVVPRRCYQPEVIKQRKRVWGTALQLYSVRSSRNWGIGDFTDLMRIVEFAAQAGAAVVGVNPLHALFPHNPTHANPYRPSSRLYQNILYLDIESVPEFANCSEAQNEVKGKSFQAQLRALRATKTVDYAAVAKAKLGVLNTLYQHFCQHQLAVGSERARAFNRFLAEEGDGLHQLALFEALNARFHTTHTGVAGWQVWPQNYRDPKSEVVSAFEIENESNVKFFEYCYWQAHLQLKAVGDRALALGMGIGLYLSLSVGVDAGGADVWANQDQYALQVCMGTPPYDASPDGQDWGMPPWRPHRLREHAYEPFIMALRKNMQVAGALCIECCVALMRIFWIPAGERPMDGCYVAYPLKDLLGILALESQRNQCLVISDVLNEIPGELSEALNALGVLSQRLLLFEKENTNGFIPPQDISSQTLVALTSYSLPTLAGYWQGRDLELREQLILFSSLAQRQQQVIARSEDRARLLMALEREHLLPAGMNVQPVAIPEMTLELAVAVHRYLARSPASIMMVQMEDLLGQVEQANIPGTSSLHLNWCHKLCLDLIFWEEDPRVVAMVHALQAERGRDDRPLRSIPNNSLPQRATIPRSTYRLQLQKNFDFAQAEQLVVYLKQLGISHVYASPCLQARPGSNHGYDIIDHSRLSQELGGEKGFTRFSNALIANEMGLIMDIVPNHMGIMGSDNTWWLDVLENGQASVFASFFDIDWSPLKDALRGKVLVPVLGDHYGSVLDKGELILLFKPEAGAFCVRYYDHEFPVDPREYPRILAHDIKRLEQRLGINDSRLLMFQSLIAAFRKLPPRSANRKKQTTERARDKEVLKASLANLCRDADIALFMDENLKTFNGNANLKLLHDLMENQAWRLAYWRVASDEINYRRFFDINELAGLRIENEGVLNATHQLVLKLIAEGVVQGIRVDHPDGLYDPMDYFRQIKAPLKGCEQPYLLVEKILVNHEALRNNWLVNGTTGYEFSNLVNGLFVDGSAETKMYNIYREFVGECLSLDRLIYDCKKQIMRTGLASELNVLAQQLSRIAELDHHTRDFTLSSLRDALSEIAAWFPVYRTYVRPGEVDVEDRRYVEQAVQKAKRLSVDDDATVFDFVCEVLLTDIAEGKDEQYRRKVISFAMKFQQYTGPLMAKGYEDTAFYRYNLLLSLNEVGGNPAQFGSSVTLFHFQNQYRAKNWPHNMLSSSTHDSKRSEDVRARINVLSEMPDQWKNEVERWMGANHLNKSFVDDALAPSKNDEYMLYQTLIGAWPLRSDDEPSFTEFRARIQSYMLKAVKEAKLHTSWQRPNAAYETALYEFIDALLNDSHNNSFLEDFLPFQQQVSRIGFYNSLSQTLLKLTAPGVPDVYQGNELWDFSLVDPDNRRPVDFQLRQRLLQEIQSSIDSSEKLILFIRSLLQTLEDGRAKLYLILRGLQLRHDHADVFRVGVYLPIAAKGKHADHLCIFARSYRSVVIITVVPRLVFHLAKGLDPVGDEVWDETWIEVSGAEWSNWLTGEALQAEPYDGRWRLHARHVLRHFPVALLWQGEVE